MPMVTEVDRLEVQVLVDNVTDSLSSTPPFVTREWPALVRKGMRRVAGASLCCANHGLSLVIRATKAEREHVVLFDDDHYYMGGVLAELLAAEGRRVTLVTPAARVSDWADHTMEVERIQGRLLTLGVELRTGHGLVSSAADGVRLVVEALGPQVEALLAQVQRKRQAAGG